MPETAALHHIPRWIRVLIHEKTVSIIIVLNTICLFLDAFPSIHSRTAGYLTLIDISCTLFFVLELGLKVKIYRFENYWKSGWNRFDFFIVLASLPSLITPFWEFKALSVLLMLRICRLIKFFRLLRFTPNGEQIWLGILRSLKASISVFLAIFLLNLLFAMAATLMFGEWAPEYFGNPLKASYSLFKVFTIEGWYEVPDLLYERSGAATWTVLLRIFYVLAVVIGGLLGFALANAVFVDEMTADNTNYVESLVKELSAAQEVFRNEVHSEQILMLENMQKEIAALRQTIQNEQTEILTKLHTEIEGLKNTLKPEN